ncbi:MAG: hypothetical protein H7X92_02585 [Chitinophagales bacterium]|nr:hypothetical protein [Hyphomicrobiales bacterium]
MGFVQSTAGGADVAFSNPNAFFTLGVRYATGRDVEHDVIAAHKWFNIAASLGHIEARAHRSDLADEMTAREIAEAQRQARVWFAGRQSKPAAAPLKRPSQTNGAELLMKSLKAYKQQSRAVFDWSN